MKIKTPPWNGQPVTYAHAKLDGHFVRVRRGLNDNETLVWTSHPTDITDQMPFHPGVAPGTSLLGELHVEGMPASYVKTALKAGDERLKITYFAIEELNEPSMAVPLAEWDVGVVHEWFMRHRLSFANYREFHEGEPWSALHVMQDFVRMGYEGVVLKQSNLLGWYKLKPVQTIDLVVTGFEDGKGKYLGLTGALKCSVITSNGYVELASVSGMSDQERVEVSLDERSYLGRTVEVRYQYVGAAGRLRHPAFVQWRDDKPARDCTLDQDPALEEYYATRK